MKSRDVKVFGTCSAKQGEPGSNHITPPLSHHQQVAAGTTSLTPRWDKCVNYVENSLIYASGRLFVNTHFQEDKKHMVGVCCRTSCPKARLSSSV